MSSLPHAPSPHRRRSRVARLLLSVAVLTAGAPRAGAGQEGQEGAGALAGVAVRAEDGAPIPFALVRVLRAGPGAGAQPAVVQQAVTNANGRFHAAGVPAGEYRLQLARIGYEPVLSPALHVRAGEALQHDLRGPSRALQLAAVTVRPDAGCLTLARLDDDPRLAALWQEARKGIETRLAFQREYRYTRIARQDGSASFRLFRRGIHTVDTTVSVPDSIEARRLRRRAEVRARGHKGAGGRLEIPNERDLLDEEYMRGQCLEYAEADTAAGRTEALVGLRFRPARPRPDVVDLDGTLWLDSRSFLARRLDVRWLRGGNAMAHGTVRFGDVQVMGSALRFPVEATAALAPTGLQGVIIRRASATLTMRYSDFQQVGAR